MYGGFAYVAEDVIDICPGLVAYDGDGGGSRLCRSSSPNVRCLPQRYMNAAPRRRTAAPPIAIPAIAPSESAWCELVDAGVKDADEGGIGVDERGINVDEGEINVDVGGSDVDDGEADLVSAGKFSPGLNAIVALCANSCCTLRV